MLSASQSSHCLDGVPTKLAIQRILHRILPENCTQKLRWFEGRNLPSTTFRFGCSTVSRALTIVRTNYPKYLVSGLLEATTTWSQMLPRLSIIPLWAFWPLRLSAEHKSTTWPWTELLELKKYMQVFSQHQHSWETHLCSLPKLQIVIFYLVIKLCVLISSTKNCASIESCSLCIRVLRYSRGDAYQGECRSL